MQLFLIIFRELGPELLEGTKIHGRSSPLYTGGPHIPRFCICWTWVDSWLNPKTQNLWIGRINCITMSGSWINLLFFLYDGLGLFETKVLPKPFFIFNFHPLTNTHTQHSIPSPLQSALDISKAEQLGSPTTDKSSMPAKAVRKMILYLWRDVI